MHKNKKKTKPDHLTPQWLTKIRLEILELQKERIVLEKELMVPLRMKQGTITVQYKTCGRKSCHCYDKVNPKKHGPYYYLVVQNTVKDGVRQQLVKDKKDIELYLNYRHYQHCLLALDAINKKISEAYQTIKRKRTGG